MGLVAVPWAQDGGLWCSMGMRDPRLSELTVGGGIGAPGSWVIARDVCNVQCGAVVCAVEWVQWGTLLGSRH